MAKEQMPRHLHAMALLAVVLFLCCDSTFASHQTYLAINNNNNSNNNNNNMANHNSFENVKTLRDLEATNNKTNNALDVSATTTSSHSTKLTPSKAKRLLLTETIASLVFWGLYGGLEFSNTLPIHRRWYSLVDSSIAYPDTPDTIPMWVVTVVAVVFPLVVVVGLWRGLKQPLVWVCVMASMLLRAHWMNGLVTSLLKVLAGRPRPFFLAVCQPNATLCQGSMCPPEACTNSKEEVDRGYQSFPSGHTSVMFSGMTFLSLLLSRVIKPTERSDPLAFMVCALPMLMAMYVAVSRTQDYKHHWEDVLFAALLGHIIAVVCFEMGIQMLLNATTEPSSPTQKHSQKQDDHNK